MRSVSMLDLRGEFALYGDEVRAAVNAVLESQQFVLGPAVTELEEALAKRLHVAHAVAVSSGTDALLCALMALGIGPGDEVILPSFTFFATAGTVARLGAKPVFAEIDPRTFNLDPIKFEQCISPRTKAVIVVHLFGQCAEMDAIAAIAGRYGLKVIADAAQAIGARYKGQEACALGDLACLSFYPTKNLGGVGEGGMILTHDAQLAEVCHSLRRHGESRRYHHERIGGNFRLDTLKAAVLNAKLRYLDEFNRRRCAVAARYSRLLSTTSVTTPLVESHQEPVYHQYSVLCHGRDELAEFLKSRQIGTGIYYPVPLHLQPCFGYLGYAVGSLPVTEDICARILSLPCHPMMSDEDVDYIAGCVMDFSGKSMVVNPADSFRERVVGRETAGTRADA